MAQSVSMELFTSNLAKALEFDGLQWKDLVERTGILQPNMSRIKAGGDDIRLSTAARISEALGYPLHILLDPDFDPASQEAMQHRHIVA